MMTKYLFLTVGLAVMLWGCSSPEKKQAKESLSGKLEIQGAWIRPVAQNGNSAAYMTLYNGTLKNDSLMSIQAKHVTSAEVHESYTSDEGLSGMRPAGVVIIPPGDSLHFQPGGLHVMLMGVKKSLSEKDSLLLNLHFAKGGSKEITAKVKNESLELDSAH